MAIADPDARPGIDYEEPAPSLETDLARLERAAVQRFQANYANVDRSALGVARLSRGTIRQSAAGVVMARSLAADEVRTAILVAPVVRGDVHTWLDMRSAVAIGLGMALGRAALLGVRAGLRRSRS
jgi:hypothetical protein